MEDTPNIYYLPGIKNNLVNLFSQLPAWTNVMRRDYNSLVEVATSAQSETYFKDLRNLYNLRNPVSAHKFIYNQFKSIAGRVNLAKADIKNKALKTENSEQATSEPSIETVET